MNKYKIREIQGMDYNGLMELYTQFYENPMPDKTPTIMALWKHILEDENYHLIVAEVCGKIVSSCMCVIISNLAYGQRPMAFIENVITDVEYRRQGLATECLNYAKSIAEKEHCYSLVLLTGSKKEGVYKFYRQAGYESESKTAFIHWL